MPDLNACRILQEKVSHLLGEALAELDALIETLPAPVEPKKLRVWWIPQVPMTAFNVPVQSVAEGVKILETLALYDAFQLKNNIKPDYCNAGGLEEWVEDAGEGQPGWVSWCDEETGCEDPAEYLALHPQA